MLLNRLCRRQKLAAHEPAGGAVRLAALLIELLTAAATSASGLGATGIQVDAGTVWLLRLARPAHNQMLTEPSIIRRDCLPDRLQTLTRRR